MIHGLRVAAARWRCDLRLPRIAAEAARGEGSHSAEASSVASVITSGMTIGRRNGRRQL
jgi:hypothetical protein